MTAPREATPREAAPTDARTRVLVVRVGAEQVALPLDAVRELVDAPSIVPVPLAPRALRGHCALRGQHLPVLDLGALLGIAREGREVPMVLVAADGGFALGVDDALDVWEPDAAQLRPLPQGRDGRRLLQGVLHRDADVAGLVDRTALWAVAVATLRTESPS